MIAELNQPGPVKELGRAQPDAQAWNLRLAGMPNRGWLDLPYYFAEIFFYRRLLEAINYFGPGDGEGLDPFQSAKDAQITKDIRHFEKARQGLSSASPQERCETLLYFCLWGNQVDLSNFSGDFDNPVSQGTSAGRLLINDARRLTRLLGRGGWSVGYVLDNVGIELYFDLSLIDFLLEQGWADRVTIHLKNCPFFLSDAMPKDLLASLQALKEANTPDSMQMAGQLERNLASGRIVLESDPFWTSALTYFDDPGELQRALGEASLAIFKGDLNYRRLLGDRHWEPLTRTEDILSYFQIPAAILRTPKSQIVAGLSAGQVEHLNRVDPHWLTSGEYGILQLVEP